MSGRVISLIYAGMGNQMFQYAAGRALALRSGSSFQLDCRRLSSVGPYAYGLGHFNVERALSPGPLPPLRRSQRIRHYFWRRLRLRPRLVKQTGTGFDQRFMSPMTDVYLTGYLQSERYFADAADTIREDFSFATPPDPYNARQLESIGAAPAISLHIRRGDYLLPEVQALLGSPTLKYYCHAVDLIASKMSVEPVVYVFSDEPEWARDNLVLPFETRVMEHNGPDKAYEDMRLMSACRHHVIANSSFSWWGAWLNPSPDKIVVAPKPWFADPKSENPDIAPNSWVRLER